MDAQVEIIEPDVEETAEYIASAWRLIRLKPFGWTISDGRKGDGYRLERMAG